MRQVVVTGGAQGIGRAVANRFRQQGDMVIVVDKQPSLDEQFLKHQIVQDICEDGAVDKVYERLQVTLNVLVNFSII